MSNNHSLKHLTFDRQPRNWEDTTENEHGFVPKFASRANRDLYVIHLDGEVIKANRTSKGGLKLYFREPDGTIRKFLLVGTNGLVRNSIVTVSFENVTISYQNQYDWQTRQNHWIPIVTSRPRYDQYDWTKRGAQERKIEAISHSTIRAS